MALDETSLEKARRKWFVRTLEVVLAAAIPAYLIALFVNRELGFAKALELPLVFASLILAIELLQRLGTTVSTLEQRVTAVGFRPGRLDADLPAAHRFQARAQSLLPGGRPRP